MEKVVFYTQKNEELTEKEQECVDMWKQHFEEILNNNSEGNAIESDRIVCSKMKHSDLSYTTRGKRNFELT